ncbi:hypothetical protein Hanom_Chr13g01210111 [Helianthus anomalus]
MSETGGKGEGERWCVVVPVWLEKKGEAVVVRTSDGEVVMEMEADVCDGVGGGVRWRLGLRTMMEGGGRCGDGDGDGGWFRKVVVDVVMEMEVGSGRCQCGEEEVKRKV